MPEPEKVTEEQATNALRSLMGPQEDPPVAEPEPEPAPEPTPEPSPETTAEPEAEAEPTPEVEAAAPTDDVESLRKSLKDRDEELERTRKSADERAAAIQQRAQQNEQILRERFLKKAADADRAHKLLKRSRSAEGVTEREVDETISALEAGMNPSSPSYTPPAEQGHDRQDQAIVLNAFLNEKGMTIGEADTFLNKWMREEATNVLTESEQRIANRDLDAFLRIAHNKFIEGQREKGKAQRRSEAVEATRVVQRSQREAARAATAAPAAPRKTGAPAPRPVDVKSLKPADISTLLRKTVADAERGDY